MTSVTIIPTSIDGRSRDGKMDGVLGLDGNLFRLPLYNETGCELPSDVIAIWVDELIETAAETPSRFIVSSEIASRFMRYDLPENIKIY